MAKQLVGLGTTPNDNTGDPIRTAFTKINANADEIYLAGPAGTNIQIAGNTVISLNSNGDIAFAPNGTGAVNVGKLTINSSSLINCGANKLTSVADPTLVTDAATKNYVDSVDIGDLNNVDITGLADTHILKYNNGTGNWEATLESAAGLSNVIEDTTPQLGGNMDANGFLHTNFASTGLDDNATGERMQITNTLISIGEAGIDYTFGRYDTAASLTLTGSNADNLGGNIKLHGSTEAGNPSGIEFKENGSSKLTWDSGLGTWDIHNNKIANVPTPTADEDIAIKGYVDFARVNEQTGLTYDVDPSDNGKIITMSNSAVNTVTFPDTLDVNFQCTIIQVGTGVTTIDIGGLDTLNGVGIGTGITPAAQWKSVFVTQFSASVWLGVN